jgi:hypothetical protein
MWDRVRQWFERREAKERDALNPEKKIVVTCTGEGIHATYPDGSVLAMTWAATRTVLIKTNDSGPWGMDFWWVVEGSGSSCLFPSGSTGEDEAREAFKTHLPGFNWNAVIEAVGCTENAQFVCWESQSAG